MEEIKGSHYRSEGYSPVGHGGKCSSIRRNLSFRSAVLDVI